MSVNEWNSSGLQNHIEELNRKLEHDKIRIAPLQGTRLKEDMHIEDEEWVVHTLKDHERKQTVSKVISIKCKNAVPKGNNYSSDMKRLSLKLVLKSGETVTRSLILKAMPSTAERRKFVKSGGLFTKEAKMYKEILPGMERLRANNQPSVERLSPVCYGVMNGIEGYLLEDLAVSGFKLVDRTKALDYQHGEIVMNGLGDFHASAKVVIEKGHIAISDISDNFYIHHKEISKSFMVNAIDTLMTTIREDWKGEWLTYVDKLDEFRSTCADLVAEDYQINANNFNSITHGDCWMTNMMFRYDNSCKPQGHRFIDFQISSYSNVGTDLQYFMNTSLNLEAFMKKEDLLKVYYNKLVNSLETYGYSGVVPTFEDILESYKASRMLGLLVALTFRPLMMQEDESIPNDLEEFTEEMLNNRPISSKVNMNKENLRIILQHVLRTAREEGLI